MVNKELKNFWQKKSEKNHLDNAKSLMDLFKIQQKGITNRINLFESYIADEQKWQKQIKELMDLLGNIEDVERTEYLDDVVDKAWRDIFMEREKQIENRRALLNLSNKLEIIFIISVSTRLLNVKQYIVDKKQHKKLIKDSKCGNE